MDDDDSIIVRWLAGLPFNSSVGWFTQHYNPPGAIEGDWEDIFLEASTSPGTVVKFTVLGGVEKLPSSGYRVARSLVVAFDRAIYFSEDANTPGVEYGNIVVVPLGVELSAEQRQAIDNLATNLVADAVLCCVSGWSQFSISRGLTQMFSLRFNRPDLRFYFDASLNKDLNMLEVISILDAPEVSEPDLDRYEISPGVTVSGHTFSRLLALDPHEAARLTANLISAIRAWDRLAPPPHE